MWNQQRLEQMISDGVEESLNLDYKAAGAFAKQTQKREEIQKDVSAFANSAGGTIIYGIKEHPSHDRKHLPERIDPIARDQFSKEWLEQIISGIQPRVQGVVIHPVQLASSANDCCYVVEIPQSETVHQAPDGKYYRRYNFENRFMQDYEVREAMNRSKHPKVVASVHLQLNEFYQKSYLVIRLQNVGPRIALHYMCRVRFPINVSSYGLVPKQPVTIEEEQGVSFYELRLPNSLYHTPLFPGATLSFDREVELRSKLVNEDGSHIQTLNEIELTLYADEMEAYVHKAQVKRAIADWV